MGNVGNTGAEFLVTPKELIASALIMSRAAEKAQKELDRFAGLIQETDSCFQGRAKESFVEKANVLIAEWQKILSGLHNRISDLQDIAGNYERAEGENINVIMENDS